VPAINRICEGLKDCLDGALVAEHTAAKMFLASLRPQFTAPETSLRIAAVKQRT
jgi:hypothetical protein